MQLETVKRIDKNISYLSKSSAIVTPIDWFGAAKEKAIQSNNDYIFWGVQDNYPEQIKNISLKNHVVSALLKFKIRAVLGKGYLLYKSRYEGNREIKELVNNSEIEEFLERIDYNSYLEKAVSDCEWYGILYTEFIRNKGKKIHSFNHLDTINTRCGKKNKNGIIDKFYYGNFSDAKDLTEIKAYNQNELKPQDKFCVRSVIPCPGFLYYPPNSWHSSAMWMQVSNEIPKFKANSMTNSMVLRYHIQYPSNYFLNAFPSEKGYTDLDRENKKTEIFNQIDDLLTGTQNAQKVFISEYQMQNTNKIPKNIKSKNLIGWSIEPIKDLTNYDAYSDDNDNAISAICTAHSVNPRLGSVILNREMSSKGSEIRHAFNLYTQLYTTKTRQMITKPFEITKKINGWDKEIKIGFKDLLIESLDKNPTGSRNIIQ
jgi:hypothetical protein